MIKVAKRGLGTSYKLFHQISTFSPQTLGAQLEDAEGEKRSLAVDLEQALKQQQEGEARVTKFKEMAKGMKEADSVCTPAPPTPPSSVFSHTSLLTGKDQGPEGRGCLAH